MEHSYKLRVEIIKGLLAGESHLAVTCGECVDGVYSVAEISTCTEGYLVDYIVRDSIDHLDQAKVFFELLEDGWLFSGVRDVSGGCDATHGTPICVTLDDAVLQMAAEAKQH
jgi:hypothetical protein